MLAGADGDIEVDMLELWQAGLFDSDAIEVAEFEDDCAAWQDELS